MHAGRDAGAHQIIDVNTVAGRRLLLIDRRIRAPQPLERQPAGTVNAGMRRMHQELARDRPMRAGSSPPPAGAARAPTAAPAVFPHRRRAARRSPYTPVVLKIDQAPRLSGDVLAASAPAADPAAPGRRGGTQ